MCVQRGRVALCFAALVFLLVVLAGAAVSLSAASAGIRITPETVVLEVDQSASLIASQSNVTWSSSNTAVATVDSRGRVTAKAAGTASITARYRGSRGTAKITVNTNYVTAGAPGPHVPDGHQRSFAGRQPGRRELHRFI